MMPDLQKDIPVQVLDLLPVLDRSLISLLRSLTAEEWQLPTVAKLWTVKDIASHLLDGNLRTISYYRDNYFEAVGTIASYKDLVDYLNQLNMNWTTATKRLSPQILIELLETTGPQYMEQLQQLKPFDTAVFPVAWAGEAASYNWFHIAREYTEKFIHQQQIRDAVNKPGMLTRELFYPFIDTMMYALPHTYSNTHAATGTVVQVKIITDIGGVWNIERTKDKWVFVPSPAALPAAVISITPAIAWKLFSKAITPAEVLPQIEISGNAALGAVALQMVAVMA